jgi:hypothetical protein
VLLHTVGLDVGSLRTVLEPSLRPGSPGGVPHGPSAGFCPRYLDGYLALGWVFLEYFEHVCSQVAPSLDWENWNNIGISEY